MKITNPVDLFKKILSLVLIVGAMAGLVFLVTWSPKKSAERYESYEVVKRDLQKSLELSGAITTTNIDNQDQKVLQIFADEADVNNIDTDKLADVELRSYEDNIYSGKVYSVSDTPRITGEITEYEVIITLDNVPEKLRNGMHGTATIVLSTKDNVLSVPNDSLYHRSADDEQYFVDRLSEERRVYSKQFGIDRVDQTVDPTEVEIGFEGDDYTEITKGLEEGDVIVAE